MKLSLLLSIALLLLGCVNQTELAKETLEARLFTDKTVTYRNIETYPGKVVCGEFTTRQNPEHIAMEATSAKYRLTPGEGLTSTLGQCSPV